MKGQKIVRRLCSMETELARLSRIFTQEDRIIISYICHRLQHLQEKVRKGKYANSNKTI